MSEEIKIITLGDIFKNIETEEKAFKFKDYIKDLQQKVEQLENIRKEAIEYVNDNSLYEEEYDYDYDYEENIYLTGIDDEQAKKDLLNILNKGDNNGK